MNSRYALFIFETSGYKIVVLKRDKILDVEFEKYYPFNFSCDKLEEKKLDISYDIFERVMRIREEHRLQFSRFAILYQNNDVILKDIEVLKSSGKRDLNNILNLEVGQLLNIDLKKYNILYNDKKDVDNDFKEVTAVLSPKYIYDIAREVERKIKSRCMGIFIDFEVLRYISYDLSIENNSFTIMEFRNEDCIMTVFEEYSITNSLTLSGEIIDDGLVNYLNEVGFVALIGNRKNKYYEYFDERLTHKRNIEENNNIVVEKLDLLMRTNKKIFVNKNQKITNFYLKNQEISQIYSFIVKIALIIIVINISLIGKGELDHINLCRELNQIRDKNELYILGGNDSKRPVYKNIYGRDVLKFTKIIEVLRGRVQSVEYDEKLLSIEFLMDKKEDINILIEKNEFKNARLDFIRSIEMDNQNEEKIKNEKSKNEKESSKESSEEENLKKIGSDNNEEELDIEKDSMNNNARTGNIDLLESEKAGLDKESEKNKKDENLDKKDKENKKDNEGAKYLVRVSIQGGINDKNW